MEFSPRDLDEAWAAWPFNVQKGSRRHVPKMHRYAPPRVLTPCSPAITTLDGATDVVRGVLEAGSAVAARGPSNDEQTGSICDEGPDWHSNCRECRPNKKQTEPRLREATKTQTFKVHQVGISTLYITWVTGLVLPR